MIDCSTFKKKSEKYFIFRKLCYNQTMKKTLTLLSILILINFSIFAGVYESSNNLNTLETEHFDIVFDDNSINEAFVIYDNCENIYEEIQLFFGISRTQRIPVAITSDINSFNAYFSQFPSPHIVLYNTIIANNNFNVFSKDYLLYIFSHELTHALTLMGNNNFIQKTFSQFINFSTLNTTSFNAEGFAVFFESRDGEGRLNNNLYKSNLLQAKIEDRFLKYNETQGNRDIYPSNVFYLYGAFFNEYIYNTYGSDKYHEFINSQHKLNLLFIDQNVVFKKVYGKSVYDVYNDFKNSLLNVPLKEIKFDNFNYNPTQLIKSDNNVLVYQTINNSVRNVESNHKEISLLDNSYYISYNDGKYVLSGYQYNNLPKTITYVINDNKERKSYEIDNFINAVNYNNQLIGILYEGQKQYIAIYEGKKLIKKIDVEDDEYIQKVSIINKQIVFSSKYNKQDRINILLSDDTRKSFYFNDKDIEIIDFSVDGNIIYISTVKENQLPRLGYIDLNDETAYINDFDISGGVYNPIVVNNDVYYIANYSQDQTVKKSNLNQFNFVKEDLIIDYNDILGHKMINYDLSNVHKYNKYKYMLDGSFFPFVFPDKYGANLGLYLFSIDPSETLSTTIFNNTTLRGDFNNTTTLQFSNITGNRNTKLKLTHDFDILNPIETSSLDCEYYYGKYFDLYRNLNLKIENQTSSFDFETFVNELSYGIAFATSVGPNTENYFSLYLGNITKAYYEPNTSIFNVSNTIDASLRVPYLIPFIDLDNIVINIPAKFVVKYNIDTDDLSYEVGALLFKKEIQSSFEKIPLYFHNIQSYVTYSSDDTVNLYVLLTNSLTQTGLFQGQLSPGFNLNYDIENNLFSYQFGVYTAF